MHAVVSPDGKLRTSRRMSHVFLVAMPGYSEILFITDAAINIFPDLDSKRDIVQNAIDLDLGLGLGEPRVHPFRRRSHQFEDPRHDRCRHPLQSVRPRPDHRRHPGRAAGHGQCHQSAGCDCEGNRLARSRPSPDPDRTDLETGNVLAKDLIFLAGADAAGIMLGARVPIIVTSRADGVRVRVASAAVGALYAHHLAQQNETPPTAS